MHPRGGIENVIVKLFIFSEFLRQPIEPGLMAEFIGGPGVLPDVIFNRYSVPGFWHVASIMQALYGFPARQTATVNLLDFP
jgi:hypothetical protein